MLTNMFDYLRFVLYAALIGLVLILYQSWEKEHSPVLTQTSVTTAKANNYVPDISVASENTAKAITTKTPVANALGSTVVHVATDLFQVEIDTLGGNIIEVKLLKYAKDLHSTTPIVLLNNLPDTRYIAQSGLLSSDGPDTKAGQSLYTTEQTNYSLSPNQNDIQVKLRWENAHGVTVTKVFTFKRDSYAIQVDYQIENHSTNTWNGNPYFQLLRTNSPPPNSEGFVNFATYFGAAISSPDKHFQKISFSDIAGKSLNQTISGGWAAMIQHYFVSAWVPNKDIPMHYFSNVAPDGLYTIGMLGPTIEVLPQQTVQTHATLYSGPTIADQLEKTAPTLKLTIDYGWFWFISAIIFWMMQKIYDVVGNWGWSIVIVTVIIKLMFYHLSAKSYRSMSGLKKLQPKIAQLKERFGDDKQKFTQATFELYKKEKVNPMSGCLPILIQIPVFIGLYWVLIESVQLRHAPFIFWIEDLSIKDPFYVLPVLMGLSMFVQQRLNPPMADPVQAKVMLFLPVIFTVLFINFPAGLMLYWFINNTLSFLQQWYIMHTLEKDEKRKK